jgi:2-dehydro-3-deoxyglucarate aldolase
MMTTVSEIRAKLAEGQPTLGSWLQVPSATVAEIMGRAEYDWVAVDLEHGSLTVRDLPNMFRALEAGGTVPFARVARIDKKDIKQALDAGAKGIIFPMVESAEELELAMSWALYPPKGRRGVGYSRANLYGKNFAKYVQEDAESTIFVAQIEDIAAVSVLEDILQVQGLDAIIVGPYDLSGSMGLTAQFDHPEFVKTLDTIQQAARRHQIPMGLHIVQPDKELLRSKIAEGYQFVAYGTDAVFLYNACECPVI